MGTPGARGTPPPPANCDSLVEPDTLSRLTHFLWSGEVEVVRRNFARASDAELLRASDADAFAEVYDRYVGQVLAWARARVGEHAADLTAEVFARAWLCRGRFRDQDGAPALPWLLGIAGRRRLGLPRMIALDGNIDAVDDPPGTGCRVRPSSRVSTREVATAQEMSAEKGGRRVALLISRHVPPVEFDRHDTEHVFPVGLVWARPWFRELRFPKPSSVHWATRARPASVAPAGAGRAARGSRNRCEGVMTGFRVRPSAALLPERAGAARQPQLPVVGRLLGRGSSQQPFR
jgi:Sigma-70 region 2